MSISKSELAAALEKVKIQISTATRPLGSTSLTKENNIIARKGCCAYLHTVNNPYEVIIPEQDQKLSKEVEERWLKEISKMFRIDIKENSDIFDGTPVKYGSNDLFFPFYKYSDEISQMILEAGQEMVLNMDRFLEVYKDVFRTCFEDQSLSLIKITLGPGYQITGDKILSKEELEAFLGTLSVRSGQFNNTMFVNMGWTRNLVAGILHSAKLETPLKEFIVEQGSFFQDRLFPCYGAIERNYMQAFCTTERNVVGFIKKDKITAFRSKYRYNSGLTLYSVLESWALHDKIFFPLFEEKFLEVLLDISKSLEVKFKTFLDSIELWNKRVYLIDSKVLSNLQAHTLIRSIWENGGEFITYYFKLRDLFPQLDPYLILSLCSNYFQHSSYGNVENGAKIHFYISDKSFDEIIKIKDIKKSLISNKGVFDSFNAIFKKDAIDSIETFSIHDGFRIYTREEMFDKIVILLKNHFKITE